ncbi:MAG: hypothetical protein ACI3ZD_11620 [Prevotella sp.]
MKQGYIKLYRSSLEDPLYFKETFTKWQAWCDLIFMAYHTNAEFFVRNVKVNAKRGCVYMGVREMSERWRWSRSKVERFIKYLEDDKRIKVKPSNVVNCIAILNYEKFQGEPTNERTIEPTTEPPYKNDKNDNILFPTSPNGDIGEVLLQMQEQMKELKERLDAQEEKPKKKREKKPVNPLIMKGREVFEKRYSDLFDGDVYYWQAKDAVAMDAITKKIIYSRSQRNMSVEEDDIVNALSAFLNSISDQWILRNFSVTNINSKYNEIVAQAKANISNGKDSAGHQDKRRSTEVTAAEAKDYEGTF